MDIQNYEDSFLIKCQKSTTYLLFNGGSESTKDIRNKFKQQFCSKLVSTQGNLFPDNLKNLFLNRPEKNSKKQSPAAIAQNGVNKRQKKLEEKKQIQRKMLLEKLRSQIKITQASSLTADAAPEAPPKMGMTDNHSKQPDSVKKQYPAVVQETEKQPENDQEEDEDQGGDQGGQEF